MHSRCRRLRQRNGKGSSVRAVAAPILLVLCVTSVSRGTTIFNNGAPVNAGVYSDFDYPVQVADDFRLFFGTNTIRSINWYGYFATGFTLPSTINESFTIRIFEDAGSVPAVDPVHTISFTSGYRRYRGGTSFEYWANIPALTLTPGAYYWLSIVADSSSDLDDDVVWNVTNATGGNGNLTFRFFDGNSWIVDSGQHAVAFSLNDSNPLLSVSPGDGGSLDFGRVRIGTTSSEQFHIQNVGGSGTRLFGTLPEVTGGEFARVSDYSYTPVTPADTPAAAIYSYTPLNHGTDLRPATVTGNDGGPDATVNLIGQGVGPTFDSSEGTGGTLDFGSVSLSQTGNLLLDLLNTTADDNGGMAALTDLTINDIQITGPDFGEFSLASFTPGMVIGQGGSLGLSLEFDPTSAGMKNALLTIFTDEDAALGGSGNSYQFDLTATAVPEPSSLLLGLCGLAALGLTFAARRRRCCAD